jgi:hypothetical protein
MIKVFWLERTELVQVRLRVYRYDAAAPCVAPRNGWTCCDADVVIFPEAPRSAWVEDLPDGDHRSRELVSEDDPRWPRTCETCGIAFDASATRQLWTDALYRGARDGQLYTLREAPVGAMWNADWLAGKARDAWTGPDGLSLHVRTPGGDWCVDGECSNCTRKQDVPVPDKPGWTRFERSHYCWVRHGDPRTGDVHVDKDGVTCEAGAGSIITGGWHGFLHHGYLTPC